MMVSSSGSSEDHMDVARRDESRHASGDFQLSLKAAGLRPVKFFLFKQHPSHHSRDGDQFG
jgi:hypothetical protein